jgi:hypothetical protein
VSATRRFAYEDGVEITGTVVDDGGDARGRRRRLAAQSFELRLRTAAIHICPRRR